MGHCYTNEEFMAQGHLHKFFGFPGVGMKTFALDVTHMLDLGVLHDFLGSIMHLCVYGRRLCPGEHISVNLSELNNKLSSFYAANPDVSSRLGHLKLDRFTTPSRPFKEFPELRCKAAQARYIVPFGLELARAINNGSEEDEMLCYAASHLHEFYFGMLNGPDFLPRPTSLLMEDHCDKFLAFYSYLGQNAARNGILRFAYKPKAHYFWHLSRDAFRMNPRLGWTYADEDGQTFVSSQMCTPSGAPSLAQ
jgi:hypothetical protein